MIYKSKKYHKTIHIHQIEIQYYFVYNYTIKKINFFLTQPAKNDKIHAVVAQIAQSVEQGTENPCVPGSIPGLGTNFLYFSAVYLKPYFLIFLSKHI